MLKSLRTGLRVGFGRVRPGKFGGEQGIGIEGRLPAANAGEVEFVAAHGDADAAFDAGSKLGEEVAALGRGVHRAVAEVRHLGVRKSFNLGGEGEQVLLGLGDLEGDALELGGGGEVVAGVRGGVVAVEHAPEHGGVVAEEGCVCLGHEMGAVTPVVDAAGAVGMDALGDGAEEGFEVEGCGVGLWVGFWGEFRSGFWIRLGGHGLRMGWVVEFGDAVFPLVELDVEDADLSDVAAFEAVELGAEMVELGLADGQRRTEDGQFGATAEDLGLLRPGLAEDRCGLGVQRGHGLV